MLSFGARDASASEHPVKVDSKIVAKLDRDGTPNAEYATAWMHERSAQVESLDAGHAVLRELGDRAIASKLKELKSRATVHIPRQHAVG